MLESGLFVIRVANDKLGARDEMRVGGGWVA